ncbi:MAG TPA: hypothetical protein VFX38_00980 [Gammaproteobacteria bacterium]|nr:hypothetical protein [Gammaproteobacteria bacterium]
MLDLQARHDWPSSFGLFPTPEIFDQKGRDLRVQADAPVHGAGAKAGMKTL